MDLYSRIAWGTAKIIRFTYDPIFRLAVRAWEIGISNNTRSRRQGGYRLHQPNIQVVIWIPSINVFKGNVIIFHDHVSQWAYISCYSVGCIAIGIPFCHAEYDFYIHPIHILVRALVGKTIVEILYTLDDLCIRNILRPIVMNNMHNNRNCIYGS